MAVLRVLAWVPLEIAFWLYVAFIRGRCMLRGHADIVAAECLGSLHLNPPRVVVSCLECTWTRTVPVQSLEILKESIQRNTGSPTK